MIDSSFFPNERCMRKNGFHYFIIVYNCVLVFSGSSIQFLGKTTILIRHRQVYSYSAILKQYAVTTSTSVSGEVMVNSNQVSQAFGVQNYPGGYFFLMKSFKSSFYIFCQQFKILLGLVTAATPSQQRIKRRGSQIFYGQWCIINSLCKQFEILALLSSLQTKHVQFRIGVSVKFIITSSLLLASQLSP